MYICADCGSVFEECGTIEQHHPYGESYATEYLNCCPNCKSDEIEEAVQCDECGEWFSEDELHSGICHDCVMDYKRDYEALEKISENEKETIKVSALIKAVLDEKEIETILYRYIEQNDIDCSAFINEDKEWFAEKLKERGMT